MADATQSEAAETTQKSDILRLILPPKDDVSCDDFFVLSATVDEAVGKVPTAELSLCASASDRSLTLDRLRKLVGLEAGLEIRRLGVIGSAVQSRRWFSGKITAVEHRGACYTRESGSKRLRYCGYSMTVQAPLVGLCRRRSRLHYASASADTVLRRLLSELTCSFETTAQAALQKAVRHFSQGDLTDYEFLVRILESCGLTYCHRMPRPSKSSVGEGDAALVPVMPTLCVFGGNPPSASISDLTRKDAASGEEVASGDQTFELYYKKGNATGKLGAMTAWDMRSGIGVDACDVAFGDALGTTLSSTAESSQTALCRARLNHVPYDNVRTSDDLKVAAGAWLRSVNASRVRWAGETTYPELRVGTLFALSGFYGIGDESDRIPNLLVVSSRIAAESKIPSGFIAEVVCKKPVLTVRIGCLQKDCTVTDCAAAAAAPSGQDAFASVVRATVCDADGKVPTVKRSDKDVTRRDAVGLSVRDDAYEFRARPDGLPEGASSVMVVRLVLPVGGLGQGLFRLPRYGDRVLVVRQSPFGASLGGLNYLLGYLPAVATTKKVEVDKTETDVPTVDAAAMTLRFDQTDSEKGGFEGAATDVATTTSDHEFFKHLNKLSSLTAPERFNGTPEIRGGCKANTFSELGFYDRHTSSVREVGTEKTEMKYVDGAAAKRATLVNLQSVGDVQVSANDRVEMNARNIHLRCPGWDTWRLVGEKVEEFDTRAERDAAAVGKLFPVMWSELREMSFFEKIGSLFSLSPLDPSPGYKTVYMLKYVNEPKVADGIVEIGDVSECLITANRRISLSVGDTSAVVLDRDGVALYSGRWPAVSGTPLTTSTVAVSAMRGVEISGADFSASGTFGLSAGEDGGAALTLQAGTASIGGMLVRGKTMSAADVFQGLTNEFVTTVLMPILNNAVYGIEPTGLSGFNAMSPLVSSAFDTASSFGGDAYSESDEVLTASKIINVLQIIFSLIDMIALMVLKPALGDEWWETPIGGADKSDGDKAVTRGDVFTLLACCAKCVMWSIAEGATLLTDCKVVRGKTEITLKTFGISVNTPAGNTLSVKSKRGNGPLAGSGWTDLGTLETSDSYGQLQAMVNELP